MHKSEIFKKAHKATKAALKAGDSYSATFSIALKQEIARSRTGGKIPNGLTRGRCDSWADRYNMNVSGGFIPFAEIANEYKKPFALFIFGKKVADFPVWNDARAEVDAQYEKFCTEFFPEIAQREAERLAKKAVQDAKHAADAAKGKELADFLGMPALKGTERQVVWAEQIRANFLKAADEKDAAKAKKRTTAKWWIENRESL